MHGADGARLGARRKALTVTVTGEAPGLEQRRCGGAAGGERGAGEGEERERAWWAVMILWGLWVGCFRPGSKPPRR